MSEPGGIHPAAEAVTPSAGAPTAGSMLRQMREAAGVDPALLASAMKVPLRRLEALENDQLDQLPGVTFARGLAASICRAFGADPAPVLERMPVAAPGLRPQHGNANQPFKRSSDSPAPMLSSSLSRPLLIAVIGLLIGAAALWLLPTLPIQLGGTEPESAPVAEGVVQESVAPVAEPAPTEPPVAAAEPVPAEAPLAAAAAEQEPAPPPAPTEVLSVTASGDTWLTVRDAGGKTLVDRLLAKDEVLALDGTLPLSVTVGRKYAASVKVRGEPFDISRLGTGTVARFRVE